MLDSPPILALNDTPTPQIPLSASAATSPAHFVPWLKKKKKKKENLQFGSLSWITVATLNNFIVTNFPGFGPVALDLHQNH